MVDLIKPSQLPAASSVAQPDVLVIDDGVVVQKATTKQIVDAGNPVATEAEALSGTDNSARMTPLRVRQVLDDTSAPSVARAQAWAESPTPPEPTNPDSKSAKTWAGIAEAGAAAANMAPQSWGDFQSPPFIDMKDGAVTQFNGVQFVRDRSADIAGLGAGSGWGPQGHSVTPQHFATIGTVWSGDNASIVEDDELITLTGANIPASAVGSEIIIEAATGGGKSFRSTIVEVLSTTQVVTLVAPTDTFAGGSWVIGAASNVAVSAAADYAALAGMPLKLVTDHMFTSPVRLKSGVRVLARGKVTVFHPLGHGFKAALGSDGVTDLKIEGVKFNANNTSDGAVAVDGVRGLLVRDCGFSRVKYYGADGQGAVTVAVGFGNLAGAPAARGLRVENCEFDVPDYGVVAESGAGGAEIEDISVTGCCFKIAWGTGVSISRNIKNWRVSDNTFLVGFVRSDDTLGPRGLGVKVWQGTSYSFCPKDGVVIGNVFEGPVGTKLVDAVSVANYTHNVVVGPNTYRNQRGCVTAENGQGGRGLSVNGGTATNCFAAVYAAVGGSYQAIVTGFYALDCDHMGYGQMAMYSFVGCGGRNFAENVYHLLTQNTRLNISGGVVDGYNKSFVAVVSGVADAVKVSDMTLYNGGQGADNTYDVFQMGNQAVILDGNFVENSAANRPRYIVGGTGENRLVSNNWMYGARTDYYQTAAASSDVFYGNKQRGL